LGLTLGVAALFFGVVFIIVGFKGGDTSVMTQNLVGMIEGQYPTGGQTSSASSTPITSTNGGANSGAGGATSISQGVPQKPGTNP